MGKRRRRRVDTDADPILKNKRKKVKIAEEDEKKPSQEAIEQEEEEEEDLNVSEDLSELEEDEYKKFANQFNLTASEDADTLHFKKRLRELPKLVIQSTTEAQPLIDIHYGYDHNKLVAEEKLVQCESQLSQKVLQSELIKEKMREIFFLKSTEDKKPRAKKEADPIKLKLANNVSLKNYSLQDKWKKRTAFNYEDKQELLVDESAKNELQKLNISLANSDSGGDNKDDGGQLQDGLISKGFIDNYFDVIAIDPEEEHAAAFRESYVKHIVTHLQHFQRQISSNTSCNRGYTRCRILILTPYKGDATQIIKLIDKLVTHSETLQKTTHKQKFAEQFEDESKFAEDDFRIGLALGRAKVQSGEQTGGTLKLFTQFAQSDLIVASPLGLRLLITAPDADEVQNEDRKGNTQQQQSKPVKPNYSFLSSIDILVLDRLSTMLMQNWEHLEEILEKTNKIPLHQYVTSSLDEIRPYYFENMAKFYRQTIVYSEFAFPELNSMRIRFLQNYRGCVQNKPHYSDAHAKSIVERNILQEFLKIEVQQIGEEIDARFNYFKNKLWEQWKGDTKVVVFCSSYVEYLQLKNYLTKINTSFQCISEYTPKKKVQSRLAHFQQETFKTLLFSERAYFFDVCQIAKMRHVLFYSLPQNAFIYSNIAVSVTDEIIQTTATATATGTNHNNKKQQKPSRVLSLFTKFDRLRVERIVGTQNCENFFADYNKSTSFVL